MILLFVALSALVIFVVATVSIGSVTAAQSLKARPAVYDLNEAVDFVADRLPPDVSAEVSYDEVRQVLLWHLDYLSDKGVASYATDQVATDELVVLTDDEPVAYILGRADEADVELADEHVVQILACQEDYYRLIGAYGSEVAGPIDPSPEFEPSPSSGPTDGDADSDTIVT